MQLYSIKGKEDAPLTSLILIALGKREVEISTTLLEKIREAFDLTVLHEIKEEDKVHVIQLHGRRAAIDLLFEFLIGHGWGEGPSEKKEE